MSADKSTDTGTPKASNRRAARSRKVTPASSPAGQETNTPSPMTEDQVETATQPVASQPKGSSTKSGGVQQNAVEVEPVVTESTDTAIPTQASESVVNSIPTSANLEFDGADQSVLDNGVTNKSEKPMVDKNVNNVEIHEGEPMEAENGRQGLALSPSSKGKVASKGSAMAADSSALKVAGAIEIASGLRRPIMSSDLEIKTLVGNRPVGSSALQVYETINVAGERPIEVSSLSVLSSLDDAGHRPITSGDFEVWETMNVSGIRPIAASPIHFSPDHMFGNRPIASNDLDDSSVLMGYID
jgi:hypothetical protein